MKKVTLPPLVAASFFMVSRGPYGLEAVVQHSGYLGALLVIALTPLLWSLPTALMVGELGELSWSTAGWATVIIGAGPIVYAA